MDRALAQDVVREFAFVNEGRTFTCCVEKQSSRPEAWWWFRVSTDERARYAPFRTTADDTRESVEPRIVQFYDELLVRRAAPPRPMWRRGAQPGSQPPAPALPATDAPTAGNAG